MDLISILLAGVLLQASQRGSLGGLLQVFPLLRRRVGGSALGQVLVKASPVGFLFW